MANEAVKVLSSNKEEVEKMVASNAYILTEMKEKAEAKGIEKGIKQGQYQEKINIAKNLLDVLDNETIAIKTGLTIEEIQKLR